MINILQRILEYRESRGWSEYQLSVNSSLPQSTISSWYRKNMLPSISSLEKICSAFGITLSEFFAENNNPVHLNEQQIELLEYSGRLTKLQKEALINFLKTL